MCLALPAKVKSIDESTDMALVALGDTDVNVSIALIDDVKPGDFLLIHVGYALNKISEQEAEDTLKLFAEAGLSGTSIDEPES